MPGGIEIKLIAEDGSELDVNEVSEIEKHIKKAKAIAVRINGQPAALNSISTLRDDDTVEVITWDSDAGKEIYRHSTSHVMAHAVKKLFPEVKLAIGPAIQDGYYYDFDISKTFTPEDLALIEKEMAAIIKKDSPFVRSEMSKKDAVRLFEEMGESYKVELINDLSDETVTIYEEDGFVDLCRGPHLASTGKIAAFKLLSVAGAYWRGNEKNKMLQRIYGTAFNNSKDLRKYLDFLEEAKKRDHRRLGKELELFTIKDQIGPGLILWQPKGAILRKTD